jgi:hypothetical protein
MRCFFLLCALTGAIASTAGAQRLPPEPPALAKRAHLPGTPLAWCRLTFRRGHPNAFGTAIAMRPSGGRYVVLDADGTVLELGAFDGKPEVSCYSPAEARKVDDRIQHSETIHGRITPRWGTSVVCGFVTDTSAECWQYSPTDHVAVKVGEWVT